MREILFRGKKEKNGEWIYGYYYQKPNINSKDGTPIEHCISDYPPFGAKIVGETVGQFTGLTDKNGKKIFEGDIVKAVYCSNYVGVPDMDFGIGVVEYCGSYYGGAAFRINIIGEIGSRVFTASLQGGVTVIGNIHDNPELLKGGTE